MTRGGDSRGLFDGTAAAAAAAAVAICSIGRYFSSMLDR
jgi:hypothetical protein